jgi:YidC/Oxa1 family membrane protein insertase
MTNGDVELHLTNRGGAIAEAVLLNHTVEDGNRVVLNAPDRIPIGAVVEQPDAAAYPEYSIVKQADGSVEFERKTPESVTIRKRFFFAPPTDKKDNYVAEMDVDFRNDGVQPYNNVGYFVTLGSARPIHPRDMSTYTRLAWTVNGKADEINVNWFAAQNYPLIGVQKREAKPFYREKINNADWAGMTNQFFTDLVTPLSARAVELWARPFDIKQTEGPNLLGIEGAMGMPGFQIQPGQTATMRFQLFTGPKLYNRLAKLEHNEAEIMNFGMWKLVSQFLLNFMNLIHSWIGNYGVSIVLLTACVKGVLWPLQNKANKSMRKMSALAPKMQELKEKYKDDPTRMNQEVMKLYKEHGVNPVGGCLPMMIQIPIFFGLFTMLGQAAELRNSRFLWVHDLSQPDTLFTIPGLSWIPILGSPAGLPINILPLIMGTTNIWLMRMTPKTGDSTQQKVMMFMPLIFLFFCYNFAAALALYYTTQNLFTILQLYQNRKQPAPVLEKVAPAGKRSRKGRP